MRKALVAGLLLAFAMSACASVRLLSTELEVSAPVAKAWAAWSSAEGVETFFAPGCKIEPKVDGAYDIYFSPESKPGERGAEGMRILSFEPLRRIAFTWNAPQSIPEIRGQRTMVIVEFHPLGAGRTRVRFTELGWGEGEQWDKAYDYFDHAWNDIVLPRFRYAMDVGPLDWQNVPELKPVTTSLKVSQ